MTNNTEHAQVGWGFWLWWVLASTVGFAVGIAVGEAVGFAVGVAVAFTVTLAVGVAVSGAITGVVLVWLLRQPAAREIGPRNGC